MNSEQLEAEKLIEQFIQNKLKKIFVLSGSAGTGKTYLITHIFDKYYYKNKKIVFTATTNKAVSVLEKMIDISNSNINFLTIHKLLNIKRIINSSGKESFDFDISESPIKNKKSIFYYDIIIIDEASMINQSLYNKIIFMSSKIKGKIIFLGDTLQLPPVNEDSSLVFSKVNYTLSNVVRNSSNILTFCNRIRNCILTNNKIKFKDLVDDNLNINKDQNKWLENYCKIFKEGHDPIILAYTNNCCLKINNLVRSKIFPNQSEKYIKGELIIFNNFYRGKDSSFYTSQQAKIDSLSVNETKISDFNFKTILNLKVKNKKNSENLKIVKKDDIPEDLLCPICYDDKIDEFRETSCGHKFCSICIKLWLSKSDTCPMCRIKINKDSDMIEIKDNPKITEKINILKNTINNCKVLVWNINVSHDIVQVIHDEAKNDYDKLLENIKKQLKEIKDSLSGNIVEEVILKTLWVHIYEKFIDNFADISYGYCITTHKSQGSTYPYVFIHAKNILAYNYNDTMKCFYTAASRTSKYIDMYY